MKIEQEEWDIISELIYQHNLHGLNYLILSRIESRSPLNKKHTRAGAIKAAQTYFSSSDTIIEDDFVKWDEEGNAMVLTWQKVPSAFIVEEDCGCGNK